MHMNFGLRKEVLQSLDAHCDATGAVATVEAQKLVGGAK